MGDERSLAVHALSDLPHESGGDRGEAFFPRAVLDHVPDYPACELRYPAEYLGCLAGPFYCRRGRRGLMRLWNKLARGYLEKLTNVPINNILSQDCVKSSLLRTP